jgi:serine/threonine protein kinase
MSNRHGSMSNDHCNVYNNVYTSGGNGVGASISDAMLSDFTIQQELGRNATGVVFKALHKSDGRVVVLKRKNVGESATHSAIRNEVKNKIEC